MRSIKTRSTPASLLFRGLVTKPTTVIWSIVYFLETRLFTETFLWMTYLETSRNLCIVRRSLKTMSRNNLQKSPKRHSKRPGDLMNNLETPGKTKRVGRYASIHPCNLADRHSRLIVSFIHSFLLQSALVVI